MGKKGAPVGNKNAMGTHGHHGPQMQLNGQHHNGGTLRGLGQLAVLGGIGYGAVKLNNALNDPKDVGSVLIGKHSVHVKGPSVMDELKSDIAKEIGSSNKKRYHSY